MTPLLACPSVYPPSADAPHEGTGWSGPLRCVLTKGHHGNRHWNDGIIWTGEPEGPPPGTLCGTFGCAEWAVVRTTRPGEWFPGWYCAEHGATKPAKRSETGRGEHV